VRMKRCKFCGRTGSRMTAINNRWVKHIDGYRCTNVAACNERVRQLGKWTGVRVLRRRDIDGTQWTIRQHDGIGLSSNVQWWVLTMAYRDHRLSSMHRTPESAKAHVDDLTASWRANSIRDYAGGSR
jgi:hypothetical protein